MKYPIAVQYQKSNIGEILHVSFSFATSHSNINLVLMMMNRNYLNYYISLIEDKKTPFEINVSESYDGELSDYLLVSGENVYFEGNTKDETIETSELLEFFKIMKKELSLGEEIVVDTRCEPSSHVSVFGINSYIQLEKIKGAKVLSIKTLDIDNYGTLKVQVEILAGEHIDICLFNFWNPSISIEELNKFQSEMYSNSKYVVDKAINRGSTNMWEGVVTSECQYKGMKIRWYNEFDGPAIKGKILINWPVFEK